MQAANYHLLLTTPAGTTVTITTDRGTIRGALAFQPLRGVGRLYDLDAEVVYEFAVTEIEHVQNH